VNGFKTHDIQRGKHPASATLLLRSDTALFQTYGVSVTGLAGCQTVDGGFHNAIGHDGIHGNLVDRICLKGRLCLLEKTLIHLHVQISPFVCIFFKPNRCIRAKIHEKSMGRMDKNTRKIHKNMGNEEKSRFLTCFVV
jgi:hypothetical protein